MNGLMTCAVCGAPLMNHVSVCPQPPKYITMAAAPDSTLIVRLRAAVDPVRDWFDGDDVEIARLAVEQLRVDSAALIDARNILGLARKAESPAAAWARGWKAGTETTLTLLTHLQHIDSDDPIGDAYEQIKAIEPPPYQEPSK